MIPSGWQKSLSLISSTWQKSKGVIPSILQVRSVTFHQMIELVEGCKAEGARVGEVVEEEVRETSLADYFTVTNGIMPGQTGGLAV